MGRERGRAIVIGGGLAGCEAAWQLASRGVAVELYEMRPVRMTPAHHTDRLAELVCSNSLGSFDPKSAPALLKSELKCLGSKLLEIAWDCRVPAGQALAVDRQAFADKVTGAILSHPLINVHRQELAHLPEAEVTVVATGPLTSESLAGAISRVTGCEQLFFFDAASPILTRESIDFDRVFLQSRYGRGEGEYINCPMDKEQYLAFWKALVAAERIELKDFEKDTPYFESCLPVEVIASRGVDTLRWGPMKPVGLTDPRSGRRPYAVVQLRQDNAAADLYSMVGFQTNLKWGEQQRVFKLIPGLEQAEFVRLGVMHRNTYVNSPVVLSPTLQLKARPALLLAGQITGTEGYTESVATGLVAGLNAARLLDGASPLVLPPETMIGALIRYITQADPKHFQPINSNWGLLALPPAWQSLDKPERRKQLADRALAAIRSLEIHRQAAHA
ncbi:MAG TPA: methylenetetrahydrofolate--tRNA-(uracil(54)-C(5))-methyltransferase (FADH(2)-oxidizing) TrmFO [Candidatus Obscuribacterales bacterium]